MKHIGFGLLLAALLGSCNTTIGMGRDFRQLGQMMEHKAQGRNFDGTEPVPQDSQDSLPTY